MQPGEAHCRPLQRAASASVRHGPRNGRDRADSSASLLTLRSVRVEYIPPASEADVVSRRRTVLMLQTSRGDSVEPIGRSRPTEALGDRTGVFTYSERPVTVLPARYVLLPLANALTGYRVKAMERKIERGDWEEGKVWRRAPDGHIMIDIAGYHRWVESR